MIAFASAHNPRQLTRVLERVAAGVRRPRAIATALGMEQRLVQAYLAVGAWLGALTLDAEPALTREGLAFVYAGRARPLQWAGLVRDYAFFARLGPGLPDADAIAAALVKEDPSLSPRAARRRANGLRRLAEPAWRVRARPAEPAQATLAFASDPTRRREPVDLRAGPDDNPDVYGRVLRALLDHGELSPAQLRGVLDAAGAEAVGIGGYIAMALRRGDATRVGESLVVTRGAVRRRDLADSTVCVALSDPEFRRSLDTGAGFRAWRDRLFGTEPAADALPRLLFGRPLATFPLAGDPGEPFDGDAAPFLACATQRDVAIAFPSSLTALAGGLPWVHRALRVAQQMGAAARLPTAIDRRARVHGGLLHPGEAPPRTVPDMLSLRIRAVRCVPAFAWLVTLGWLDRHGVCRVRAGGGELWVEARGQPTRRLDDVVDGFAQARGWVVARGPDSAPWPQLADVAEALGLLAQPYGWVTLDEPFFVRLQSDPEHRDLLDGVIPFAELLERRISGRAPV